MRLWRCAVMSANEHQDTVFECIQGGAEDYLVKPVTKNAIQCIWQHVWRRQVAARVPQARDEVGAPRLSMWWLPGSQHAPY